MCCKKKLNIIYSFLHEREEDMTWIDNFYLSANITDDRKAVKRRICWHKDILEYYLLAISTVNDGMIDIIPALEFKTWPQRKKDQMVIVGVSSGYNNAKELVAKMAEESFEQIGNYNLKSYFSNMA